MATATTRASTQPTIPSSKSRKVRGFVKVATRLRALEQKRAARYAKSIAPLDDKIRAHKDQLTIRGAALNVVQRKEVGQIVVLLGIQVPNGPATEGGR